MIDVHSWTTGNARKVYIMLEECGLEYRIHSVNINAGDQHKPEFLAISPNNKIPAIIDQDGPAKNGKREPYSLFESGAILMYLAHKTGKFLSADPRKRIITIQWLMFQMGEIGPMFGQAGHFVSRKDQPGMQVGLEYYSAIVRHKMEILDGQFAQREYIAGDEYTIADIALYPWCQQPEKRGLSHDDYPHFKRWFDQIAARPATRRADEVCAEMRAAAGVA